ncbi:tail completion protein gp17 [Sphingobium yanoikuyae]|uniref:tail completion protein gp17 n=1 Tax=Sphingobium yanoikuyae TaxID=13690 RepID=UPI002FDA0D9A
MDMQRALRARLLADDLVSALASGRVFWGIRPPKSLLPAITLNVIPTVLAEHMKGQQSLQFFRVQMDSWGDSYAAAQALVDAALACLLPRLKNDNYYFRTASATVPRDLSEETTAGTIHRKQTDLTIRFSLA